MQYISFKLSEGAEKTIEEVTDHYAKRAAEATKKHPAIFKYRILPIILEELKKDFERETLEVRMGYLKPYIEDRLRKTFGVALPPAAQ